MEIGKFFGFGKKAESKSPSLMTRLEGVTVPADTQKDTAGAALPDGADEVRDRLASMTADEIAQKRALLDEKEAALGPRQDDMEKAA